MKLVADINQCAIEDWGSNTGEYNARELQVEMCEELRQCSNALVTFKLIDGTVYESKVTDGKAEVPTIDEPQIVEIGLYAEDVEGDKCSKRYSPKPTRKYFDKGSYTPDGEDAPIPTPGLYAELLEMIKNSGGGSDINIIDEFGFPDDEYNRNDVYNANVLNRVISEIAENFASIDELNRFIANCEANYKKTKDNLEAHIKEQQGKNTVFNDNIRQLLDDVWELKGQSVVIDEISDLVGGAE